MTTPAIPYKLSNSTRNTASGIFLGSIGAAVGFFLLCLWGTTQYTAHYFGYQQALGDPLFHIHRWPIYEPWMYFWWLWHFGDIPEAQVMWNQTVHFLLYSSHSLVIIAIIVAVIRARRVGGKTDTHGSAHWATDKEIRGSGLLNNSNGVYVGAWQDSHGKVNYLRHDGEEHILAFSPTGSGKGIGLVVPTLLAWPHSVIVHDAKGENWALTSGWRSRELDSICLRFDPTALTDTARYNPLMEIRKGQHEVRDAQNIADILIDPNGDSQRDHWDLTAYELLVAVILYVMHGHTDKTLAGCLHVLSDPKRPLKKTLQAMLETEHPVIAGTARAILDKSSDERSSVVSTAIRCLSLFRDPVIAENTSASDFSLGDLMNADKPVSLYLTIPTSDISRTRPLMRMILNQIGRRLTEHLAFKDGRTVPHYKHRLLMLLDEFPALGKLDFFQTSLAYLRGYGVKCYLIAQDLSQLYAAYGRNESILSNCHIRIAYAPNKVETAKLLSDMAGTMTVHKETRTYTGSRLQPVLMHVIAAEQETQRPLLAADEVMRLPVDDALIFMAGMSPIYGKKIRYYQDRILVKRAMIEPLKGNGSIVQPASQWTTKSHNDDELTDETDTEITEGADLI